MVPKIYNVPEAAKLLGLSQDTLRAWIFRQELEIVRIGRRVFVREETIQDLIRNGTRRAINA